MLISKNKIEQRAQIQFAQYFFMMRSCSHAHALPVIWSSSRRLRKMRSRTKELQENKGAKDK